MFVASVVVLAVLFGLLPQVPVLAAPPSGGSVGTPARSVPTGVVRARPGTPALGSPARPVRAVWPAGGSADVPVSDSSGSLGSSGRAGSAASGGLVSAGGLPVRVGAGPVVDDSLRVGRRSADVDGRPASVRVRVADQGAARAAGVSGVVLSLSRSDGVSRAGAVRLQAGYAGFADGFGANFGARLQLVGLPACALTTPARVECRRQTPLDTVNDEVSGVVSADLTVAGDNAGDGSAGGGSTVVALAGSRSSPGGTFTATSLTPAYGWAAGGQGGTFTYRYPLKVPPGLGGPAPQLSLGYDSGMVDGQTRAQNGQAPWTGEGWAGLEPGYVERSYRPCAQDGGSTPDLCWFSAYNATLVFGGRSTRLVRDQGSGVWHAADDSGLRVEQLFGSADNAPGANGSYNREYWRVTTLDGTQYFFGANRRYAGDPAQTRSTLNEPVFGNNPGEPCNTPGVMGRSWCPMGYRWNLDYVVDPRGNSMTYVYQRFGGAYTSQNSAVPLLYDVSSVLDHVDYGTRAGSEAAGNAPMRVVLGASNRCLNACGQTPADYPSYRDTPWDLFCASGQSTCPANTTSPVYFNPLKLSSVTTQVSAGSGSGSGYRDVDRWDLTYQFPDPGDGTAPNLWLASVTHTGVAADGSQLAEPTITFDGVMLANRKNYGHGMVVSAFNHRRLTVVHTGTGAETDVTYSPPECEWLWDPDPPANPYRCFPEYFTNQYKESGWDWFHKYVVTQVVDRDLTGGSPDEVTAYRYSAAGSSDTALWHHDYNESVQLTYRSWDQWQGYTDVTETHGPAGGAQTVTTDRYFRGMNGDALPTITADMAWGARRAGLLEPLPTGLTTAATPEAISGRGGRCLDISGGSWVDRTLVQLWDCNAGDAQVWRYHSDDLTMRSPASGKCLDVAGGGTAAGTQVWLYTCNGGLAQQWQRTPDGGLRNPNSGRCLDLSNAGVTNGTRVQIWDCNDSPGQVWQPQPDGTLLSPQAQGRCTDVAGGGTANNTTVWTWPCNGGLAQTWQPQPDATMVNPNSGRCLTATGAAAGSGVQIVDCTAAAGQIWTPQADGTLKNPASGRCLDVSGSSAIPSGTPLVINDCNPALLTQQWTGRYSDADGLAGFAREEQTLDSAQPAGSQLVASTIHDPTVTQTALRPTPVLGGQDWTARMVTEPVTRTRTWIAADARWRWTRTDTSYDQWGLPTDVKDLGDTATSDDDRCTHTDYTRNLTTYLISYPSQVLTTDCATTPGDSDYLAGSQTFYDGATSTTTAPTQGLATKTTALASVSGGTETWKQTGRAGYDTNGRVTSSYDALDRQISTAYTPASGGPVTATTVTNPMGWTATTTVDPGKAQPTTITDVNNKTTTAQYDPLGRLVKVWKANRPTTATPDVQYAYALSDTVANSVQTQKLGPAGQQITSYSIYDGRLRARQTQTPAPQAVGGRVVTDTGYDGRGLAVKTSVFWNNASGPTGSLASFTDAAVVNQHRYSYDTLRRRTTDALYSGDTLKWQTSTAYDGDRTTVTPPAGGIATTTISNARGKTTTLRQYLGGTPTGAYQDTSYSYDRLDRQTAMSDPAGNLWTTRYDLRGRSVQTTDPDKGTGTPPVATTQTFDDAGQLLTATDSRGVTLAYSYDTLGRKTALWQGAVGTGTKLADWTYDPVLAGVTVKGQPATANRYVGGAGGSVYSSIVTGYDDAYRPLGTTVRIPAAETGLAGDWTTATSYNVDGTVASTTYPAVGGLAAETVTTGYDTTGLPISSAGLDTYVADTQYTYWGAVAQQLLGADPKQVKLTNTVDEATGRLTQIATSTQTGPGSFAEQLTENYGYNPAGQVTTIQETNAGSTVSNQCFSYDGLQQLTEAWTTTATTCQTSPSQAVVGGPDPYWTSYRYDTVGDRTQDISHAATGDTTHTYTYPAAGAPHPHGVTQVTATGAATGTSNFGYDNAGNTTTRNLAGKPGQTLTWDPEGHLATITDTGGTTSYLYDANGNRLIAHDTTGSTLYLGGTEIHRDTAGATTCTRFYGSTAVRTNPGTLTWLASDNHGTGELAIDATTLTTTRRKTDPFGNPRGSTPTWPTTHGYVNRPTDPTGLTHLGAREYDPSIGRFISVDPILNPADPQQVNGYAYADNNPTTASDPDGLIISRICLEVCGGPDDRANQARIQAAKRNPPGGCNYVWAPWCAPLNRSGGSGGGGPKTVTLSPHVLIKSDDPAYPKLKADWDKYSARYKGYAEANVWSIICRLRPHDCGGDLAPYFTVTSLSDPYASLRLRDDRAILLGTASAAGAMFIRRLNDPQSMRGATEDEVDEMAKAAGLQSRPLPATAATGGRGTRYFDPANSDITIITEAGDPSMRDPVHQGPYLKYQVRGQGKAGAVRVPLAGNPNPDGGFSGPAPAAIAGWGVGEPDTPESGAEGGEAEIP